MQGMENPTFQDARGHERKTFLLLAGAVLLAVLCTFLLGLATVPPTVTSRRFVLHSEGRALDGCVFSPTSASPSSPAPAVLVFHGVLATKEWMTTLLTALAINGMHAFAIDQAGHGRSSGAGGENEARRGRVGENILGIDGSALIEYAARQPGVDPFQIHLAGWSMGGAAVLGAGLNSSVSWRLRSTVLIGSRPSWVKESLINETHPPNLLAVCGKHDELISETELKQDMAVAAGVDALNAGQLYGSMASLSGRMVIMTGTDHIYEPADVGVHRAVLGWVKAATLGSSLAPPTSITSPIEGIKESSSVGYEMLSLTAGLLWVTVLLISLTIQPPVDKGHGGDTGTAQTQDAAGTAAAAAASEAGVNVTNEAADTAAEGSVKSSCSCCRCCRTAKDRPVLMHGLTSFGGLIIGCLVIAVPSPIGFLPLLCGWVISMAVLYRVMLSELQKEAAESSIAVLDKEALRDAVVPLSVFVAVFTVLQIWLAFAPFDMGQVTPLFQCLFGTEGDATYKRFVLYLLFWALLTVFFVYDMACLRMTLPARRAAGDDQAVVSTQEDGETWQQAGARLALAIFWQFVARSWVYCSILAIEFIPILLFDVRVLGPFGFVVLFLVPFAGFCLLASVFAVVGEVYGRSVFATSLVFSGIMANLIGAALTFG